MNRYPHFPPDSCHVCESNKLLIFYESDGIPTQASTLVPSYDEAIQAPRGDIKLAFCQHCSYICNQLYDTSKLDHSNSDISLEHSPIFNAFSEQLAQDLIDKYDLREKTIVDVGCGDGDFLKRICKMGNNRGVGIDPGYNIAGPKEVMDGQVKFIKDFYSEKYAHLEADIVLCRHVLMDIDDPKGLLTAVRKALDTHQKALLYFEVPNAEYNFGERVVWNIIYEHGSWFTPTSLSHLFRQCGFEVLDVSYCWNDEYLGIVARPVPYSSQPPAPDSAAVQAFGGFLTGLEEEFRGIVGNWHAQIEAVRGQGKKIVIWGSGSRGITFLNTFDLREVVDFVVDINPKRQNMYIPGSAHLVRSPDDLREYRPDLIIIVNPTYDAELRQQAKDMGLDCEFWILH